ncbi:IclR family transcriptional regulator [Streptomyces justiciae]|uniref:IclR family transcriptional regulator n=1 Tax=Streptomyces justiciae TaxID=2780140 RepID=UPI0021180C50|nr:IclR family transcriptional regulator [Streptomyces justiciae]MCW8384643.1 IclR family transcriptional regulator [Streptomyces justiciae]
MRSVFTALRVLEAVSQLQPVGLSELSRRLGLPKTTVQRGLVALADAGWLENDQMDSARWIVSTKAFVVGSTVGNRSSLRDRALPHMNGLGADVRETIHLMIPDGDQVVLIERLDSPHPVRAIAPLGARAALHASSNGKAILAHLPEDETTRYMERGLAAVTEHTITEPAELLEELALIRKRGYAVANEELQDGVVSVAAPILVGGSRPVGSLSISAPKSRMPKSVWADYGKKVRHTADSIAGALPTASAIG